MLSSSILFWADVSSVKNFKIYIYIFCPWVCSEDDAITPPHLLPLVDFTFPFTQTHPSSRIHPAILETPSIASHCASATIYTQHDLQQSARRIKTPVEEKKGFFEMFLCVWLFWFRLHLRISLPRCRIQGQPGSNEAGVTIKRSVCLLHSRFYTCIELCACFSLHLSSIH